MKTRTFLIIGLVVFVSALAAGGFMYLIYRGTAEARALAPWPGVEIAAVDVASPDLTSLGLLATGQRDARAAYGPAFADGAVVEYSAAGSTMALVAALRYSSSADAGNDFGSIEAWAQTSCGRWTSFHFGASGVIHCVFASSHDLILWRDNWILDVEAGELGGIAPAELAGKIAAAAAAHWQGRSSGL